MAKKDKPGRQQSVYMSREIWDEVTRRSKAERRSENQIIEMILDEKFQLNKGK